MSGLGGEVGRMEAEGWAERQHGVLTRTQALGAGLGARQVSLRVERGEWAVVYPKVYRVVGAPQTWRQRAMAACLWAGGMASHTTAAALWGFDGFSEGALHVATPRNIWRTPTGVSLHANWTLARGDARVAQQIPATSMTRTLIDLASQVSEKRLEHTLDSVLTRGFVTVNEIKSRLARLCISGRTGAGILERLVNARTGEFHGDSVLETKLLRLLQRKRIPRGVAQYAITDDDANLVAQADLAYPQARIAVQVEGFRWHGGRARFVRDLETRNQLQDLGWRVLHVTWEDLRNDPNNLVATLRRWLSASAPRA
ncbi:MAG: type IV toxin-antitoxin system AbiEi family antitoxin domain-containing protein [Myxococcaceae bacterium]